MILVFEPVSIARQARQISEAVQELTNWHQGVSRYWGRSDNRRRLGVLNGGHAT